MGVIPNKWYQSLAICHNSCLLHFSPGILLSSPLPDCMLHQSASRMHCMRYNSLTSDFCVLRFCMCIILLQAFSKSTCFLCHIHDLIVEHRKVECESQPYWMRRGQLNQSNIMCTLVCLQCAIRCLSSPLLNSAR